MKKTVIRFGLYGVTLMVIILLVSFYTFRHNPNWEVQEVIGYTTIVLSLAFVYFGIRHWRDNYNNGNLSFGQGLKLGLLITLFPSMAFGLFSWLQASVFDTGFSDRYYSYQVQKLKASTPAAEWEQALQQIQSEKEMFSSPFVQFGVMFLTVFLIGIVITVVSSLILQRKSRSVAAV